MFKIELDEKVKKIEEVLKGYLPREEGLQETIMKAVNYSVLCGGKRLRPLFLVECNVLCGGAGLLDPLVCAFAAALEMIHTYSLVHDDLPAIDNDKYRRGQLTTHAKYGEAMGILTGDALLNLAFETVSGVLEKEEDAKRLSCGARAIRMLSGKSGIYGMIGGQVVDVERTGSSRAGFYLPIEDRRAFGGGDGDGRYFGKLQYSGRKKSCGMRGGGWYGISDTR